MNFSLEKLVKNLSDYDFKHFTQEFWVCKIKVVKTKRCLPLWIHGQFWKIFWKKNYLIKKYFYSSLKTGMVKELDVHITDEEYLTCIKIWNRFNMRNMDELVS